MYRFPQLHPLQQFSQSGGREGRQGDIEFQSRRTLTVASVARFAQDNRGSGLRGVDRCEFELQFPRTGAQPEIERAIEIWMAFKLRCNAPPPGPGKRAQPGQLHHMPGTTRVDVQQELPDPHSRERVRQRQFGERIRLRGRPVEAGVIRRDGPVPVTQPKMPDIDGGADIDQGQVPRLHFHYQVSDFPPQRQFSDVNSAQSRSAGFQYRHVPTGRQRALDSQRRPGRDAGPQRRQHKRQQQQDSASRPQWFSRSL